MTIEDRLSALADEPARPGDGRIATQVEQQINARQKRLDILRLAAGVVAGTISGLLSLYVASTGLAGFALGDVLSLLMVGISAVVSAVVAMTTYAIVSIFGKRT